MSFKKGKHHAKAAHAAMQANNHQLAMVHLGHALRAMQDVNRGTMSESPDESPAHEAAESPTIEQQEQDTGTEQASPMMALRSRLGKMGGM